MKKYPILSVTISTWQPTGLDRVIAMQLPEVENVEYIVSWQKHENRDIPDFLKRRDDLKVVKCDLTGLSNNRNNAIKHASGEICLIADDDIIYSRASLINIIKTFQSQPDLDLAVFKYSGQNHDKSYPLATCSIPPIPRHFNPCSIEMAFRRKTATLDRALYFNAEFGLGAPTFKSGEDDMIFLRAIRLGLKCMFFPIEITEHRGLATGRKTITDPGILLANGAVIALTHPVTFLPRIFVNAWRIKKQQRSTFWSALIEMTKGAFRALGNKEIRHYALLP